MTHLWMRAEERPNEARAPLTPEGAEALLAAGFGVTVEESAARAIPTSGYASAGCKIMPEGAWRTAPTDAIILGLKELPEDGTPLRHRHIMFGHAYKGQPGAAALLARFREGGGTLLDLESLTDDEGRRVAAFGHWAGFAGAAVALQAWVAQRHERPMMPLAPWPFAEAMLDEIRIELEATPGPRPRAIVIGAEGRAGRGAVALLEAMRLEATQWDKAETAAEEPAPTVLDHDILLNCILAVPGCPVLVPQDAGLLPRRLRVIGDIACDPSAEYTPVRCNDRLTDWTRPARRLHDDPPLDVVAIDNLPSLLPVESSRDFAAQLLPHLLALRDPAGGAWARAAAEFDRHIRG